MREKWTKLTDIESYFSYCTLFCTSLHERENMRVVITEVNKVRECASSQIMNTFCAKLQQMFTEDSFYRYWMATTFATAHVISTSPGNNFMRIFMIPLSGYSHSVWCRKHFFQKSAFDSLRSVIIMWMQIGRRFIYWVYLLEMSQKQQTEFTYQTTVHRRLH